MGRSAVLADNDVLGRSIPLAVGLGKWDPDLDFFGQPTTSQITISWDPNNLHCFGVWERWYCSLDEDEGSERVVLPMALTRDLQFVIL